MKKDAFHPDFGVSMLLEDMLTVKKDVLRVNYVKLYVQHKQLLLMPKLEKTGQEKLQDMILI